jgi:RimJ/RimL family protein N-acetyltransferase
LIGVVTLSNIDTDCRHCTIDITICDRDFWGRGFGVETMQLVLDYCFNRLGMHRVSAETFDYNDAWQRLVEGSGFTREGTARDYLFLDGRFWDKQGFALLETEYSARFAHAS